MFPVKALLGLAIACLLLPGQTVTVDSGDWSTHGIEITSYFSPDFAAKLEAATWLGVPRKSLLPFSFFLTKE